MMKGAEGICCHGLEPSQLHFLVHLDQGIQAVPDMFAHGFFGAIGIPGYDRGGNDLVIGIGAIDALGIVETGKQAMRH